jgi:hypothetical protein
VQKWAVFFFIFVAAGVSVWLRMDYRRVNAVNGHPASSVYFQDTKPSQLSSAVQGLMATAGGVYLSLVMIVSFLKINIPQIINVELLREAPPDLTVDPLALVSMMLAIMEPFVLKLALFIRKIDFL